MKPISLLDYQYYDNVCQEKNYNNHCHEISEVYASYEKRIKEYFLGRNELKVLELGAGSCALSLLLSKNEAVKEVVCFDISLNRMEQLSRYSEQLLNGDRKKLQFIAGDFNQPLPFEDNVFDLVVFDGALHHSRNIWSTISECYRILTSSGLLVAQREPFLSPLRIRKQLKNLLKTDEVKNLVSENIYLKEQYEYYLQVYRFDVHFLPYYPTLGKKLFSFLNGIAYDSWTIFAYRK